MPRFVLTPVNWKRGEKFSSAITIFSAFGKSLLANQTAYHGLDLKAIIRMEWILDLELIIEFNMHKVELVKLVLQLSVIKVIT